MYQFSGKDVTLHSSVFQCQYPVYSYISVYDKVICASFGSHVKRCINGCIIELIQISSLYEVVKKCQISIIRFVSYTCMH